MLTQEQLGEALGVSRSHISRAENGQAGHVLTVGELQAWVETCGSTVAEVLAAVPDWRTDTVRGVAAKLNYDLEAPDASGPGVIAATEVLKAEALDAWADLAEVRRWAHAGPGGCAPYRIDVAGMLERLDTSFATLRAIEDRLRRDLDAANKAKREAQDQLRAAGQRLEAHGVLRSSTDPLDVDLAQGVDLLVGSLKERLQEAQAELLSCARRKGEWEAALAAARVGTLSERSKRVVARQVKALRTLFDVHPEALDARETAATLIADTIEMELGIGEVEGG